MSKQAGEVNDSKGEKKLVVIMSGPCSGNVLVSSDNFYK